MLSFLLVRCTLIYMLVSLSLCPCIKRAFLYILLTKLMIRVDVIMILFILLRPWQGAISSQSRLIRLELEKVSHLLFCRITVHLCWFLFVVSGHSVSYDHNFMCRLVTLMSFTYTFPDPKLRFPGRWSSCLSLHFSGVKFSPLQRTQYIFLL